MAIKYKMDVLRVLKEAGYSSNRIREEKIIGQRTIQQIRDGEIVSINTLDKICRMLHCQPGDILMYVDEECEAEGR